MRKRAHRQIRDPMACMTRRMPLADDQTRDLGLAYHLALQALLNGNGTEQTWSTLACSINIALLLSECGIEAAAIPTIKIAQEALLRVRDRAQRTGKWAFDGEGIRVILAAVNIHDEQVGIATRKQITDALHEVHRRIDIGEVFIDTTKEAA